jgi:hypothetical protein
MRPKTFCVGKADVHGKACQSHDFIEKTSVFPTRVILISDAKAGRYPEKRGDSVLSIKIPTLDIVSCTDTVSGKAPQKSRRRTLRHGKMAGVSKPEMVSR